MISAMRGLILLISFLILGLSPVTGQQRRAFNNSFKETKNAIYGTFGTYAPIELFGAVVANYERRLVTFNDPAAGTLWLKAGYGLWAAWLAEGDIIITGLTWLPGHGSSHPEFGLGFSSLFNRKGYDNRVYQTAYLSGPVPPKSHFRENWPAVSLGYRYQKLDGNFVFRIGGAYPEGAYISLGFAL